MTMKKIRVYPVALGADIVYSAYYTHGLLMAYAKSYKEGLLRPYFEFDRIVPVRPRQVRMLLERFRAQGQPVVFLLSSYVWSHDSNMDFARKAKEILPNSLCIIGGPHVPRAERPLRKFMDENDCIDVAVRGEGEQTLAELLECLGRHGDPEKINETDFSGIAGVASRLPNGEVAYTGARDRIKDINILPSPYLTGEFDHLGDIFDMAVVETNRGCPFGCTFCDWGGATLSKIYKFDEERVVSELEFLAGKKTKNILFIDANFGVFDRDIGFAEKCVSLKRQLGYPITVGHFLAKNSSDRVGNVIRVLSSEKMLTNAQASLQTTDDLVLKNIHRSNIKTEAYENLISVYYEVGEKPSTDILMGLPGQNYESILGDFQFCFDRHLEITSFPVSVLPNSPMADEAYIEKHNIVLDSNGFIVAANGFDEIERDRMIRLRVAMILYVNEKFLFYFLLYLQVEHGIKAMDFVSNVLLLSDNDSSDYPYLTWINDHMVNNESFFGAVSIRWDEDSSYIFENIDAVMAEIARFSKERMGIHLDDGEVANIMKLQAFIMPRIGFKKAGDTLELDYDMVSYFRQYKPLDFPNLSRRPESFRPLSEFFGRSVLTLPSQGGLNRADYKFSKSSLREPQWALDLGWPV